MGKPVDGILGVTLSKAEAIALIRAGWVRAWALRGEALILLHIFSMGLNSGE